MEKENGRKEDRRIFIMSRERPAKAVVRMGVPLIAGQVSCTIDCGSHSAGSRHFLVSFFVSMLIILAQSYKKLGNY